MLTIVNHCWLCKQPLYIARHGICSFCVRSLKRLITICPRCGLESIDTHKECGRCLILPPAWHKIISLTDYQPPLSLLIQQYKYYNKPQIAYALARLFLLHFQLGLREGRYQKPDLLFSVPLHHHKHWRRGFDQVHLIVKLLARWLNCEYHTGVLIRSRVTLVQQQLSARQRKANVKGAFQLNKPVNGKNIAIFDDVITTGTTLEEISQLFICAGAGSVQAWSLCRTL